MWVNSNRVSQTFCKKLTITSITKARIHSKNNGAIFTSVAESYTTNCTQ